MKKGQVVLSELVALCPDFSRAWADESYLWLDSAGNPSLCGVFAALSHYVAERLERRETVGMEKVFEYAEQKILDPDGDITNAIATCLFENLLNRVPERIDPTILAPLLGRRARQLFRDLSAFSDP